MNTVKTSTILKTVAAALVLATTTVANAATPVAPRAATTQSVAAKMPLSKTTAGKTTASRVGLANAGSAKAKGGISLAKRHHVHVARRLMKHGTLAHGAKVARTPGQRQVVANHRVGGKTTVIR